MNIIYRVWCCLKVRAVGLSTKELLALCDCFERESKLAEYALKVYFSYYTPDKEHLKRVREGADKLKLLYYNNIRRGRKLAAYEQDFLVSRYLPINRFSRYPSALDNAHLNMLFEKSAIGKLTAYVRSFTLSPDLEHRLVAMCENEDNTVPFVDSYRMVLSTYLSSMCHNKFQTPAVQLSLLALNDEELIVELIRNCTMDNNILFVPTVKQIAESCSRKVIEELLFRTYIDSEYFSQVIQKRFPDLRWIYEIARLRKPLRKLEREIGFIGVEAPSKEESDFIFYSIEADKDDVRKAIPQILLRDVTPYFCAWVANEFPEYTESAYRKVRKIAEKYREKYKK